MKVEYEKELVCYSHPTRQELEDWVESIDHSGDICPKSKADFLLLIDQHVDPASPLNTRKEVQGYTSIVYAWSGEMGSEWGIYGSSVITCDWEKDGKRLFSELYDGDGKIVCYVGEKCYDTKIY